jgi:hypothetical protein
MFVKTIAFEIADVVNGVVNEFLIENTVENQEMVLSHRHTRAITFGKMDENEFAEIAAIPAALIDDIILIELFANATVAEVEVKMECNCESSYCEHGENGKLCDKDATDGDVAPWVGIVCPDCFEMYEKTANISAASD